MTVKLKQYQTNQTAQSLSFARGWIRVIEPDCAESYLRHGIVDNRFHERIEDWANAFRRTAVRCLALAGKDVSLIMD